MKAEEYLEILKNMFKDFKFFPEDHHYEYKGKRIGISVTALIEQYTQEFDSDLIAERVAIKQGKSKQEVLDEWQQKNECACEKGHLGHLYVQSLWNGENVLNEIEKFTKGLEMSLENIFNQADNFYQDYKDKLEHLADEFVIGSQEYDIASAVDHIFRNKTTRGLVLVDYKTNTDIYKNEKYAGKMKAPLQHLKDIVLNHYNLQLSIYKYLIEKYSGLKIEKMFIVWFSEINENYQIIDVSYLEKEVENILNWRLYE